MNKGKYIVSFALLLAGGALLFPRGEQIGPETVSPASEISMKQQLLDRDVSLTDELCRNQCSISFQNTLGHIRQSADVSSALKQLQQLHPHMQLLIYSWKDQTLDQGVKTGELDSAVSGQTRELMEQAKQSAQNGKPFKSQSVHVNDHTYLVLGEPSEGGASLVGVVQQTILKEVSEHQKKNLRIVPYPSDNRYKVESVDSRTLQDVKVDHPEDNEGTSHYHTNQVVVRFKQEPTQAELAQIQAEIGAGGHRKLGYTYVFESAHMEAKQLMAYFEKWDVAYVEPHFLYMTNDVPRMDSETPASDAIVPNDVLYQRYQWNLPMIETEKGWSVNKGSKDVVVAIVDTGVDLNHPDLQAQLVSGINVVDPKSPPLDDVGHGTHVAGVISALVNNSLGIAGMTWNNPIMPVKVLDQTGAGSTYSVAQGIIWATDHGAKVINMSLGNYAEAQFLHDAIRYAYDHDVVLIAASGNDNTDRPGYPAAYPEVFAVAATDAKNNKASFSNYGDYIDAAAPGVNIASTYPHNQYAALSGTSMASPHVTALAALIRSVNPALKNTEVMDLIRQTAQDLGPQGKDKYFGFGLIDVVQALNSAGQSQNSLTNWPQTTERELDAIREKFGNEQQTAPTP
ncbi:S8 family peptidase [Paenibacillus thalictri]|uniref:Peptidase S8 n=1 Tax=Paenibacillus thalictri TaxID=2527873 RepID=A0A4Q9DS88_9BACL|nr:S8 family peptidase [Paenibacillus thalictri]TBL78109.1 peptidase S8 [Paenibacillus thalictri]